MAIFNNPEICVRCVAKCCRYFMLQLDTPTCKNDFENIRWYLCHEGTTVFVEKRKWYLHVDQNCRHLEPSGRCGIYDKRPDICREHDPGTCEFDAEYQPDLQFNNIDELDIYIAKRFSKVRRVPSKAPEKEIPDLSLN
jgi:Fe-S-cluster containining protein